MLTSCLQPASIPSPTLSLSLFPCRFSGTQIWIASPRSPWASSFASPPCTSVPVLLLLSNTSLDNPGVPAYITIAHMSTIHPYTHMPSTPLTKQWLYLLHHPLPLRLRPHRNRRLLLERRQHRHLVHHRSQRQHHRQLPRHATPLLETHTAPRPRLKRPVQLHPATLVPQVGVHELVVACYDVDFAAVGAWSTAPECRETHG